MGTAAPSLSITRTHTPARGARVRAPLRWMVMSDTGHACVVVSHDADRQAYVDAGLGAAAAGVLTVPECPPVPPGGNSSR